MIFTFRKRAFVAAVLNAWPAWLALLGVAIAIIVGRALSADASTRVRYAGTMLQVFGLATVAFGLREVRRSFGRPSLLQKVLAWLRQIVAAFRKPQPISIQVNEVLTLADLGQARTVVSVSSGASLDRRVAVLEENLNRLRDEVDTKENEIRKDLGTMRESLGQEQRARETEDRRMAAKLEELAVGGVHLEFVGLAWLLFGVLAASIPDEIVKLSRIVCR